MSEAHVVTSLHDRVLTVRFNRPDKKNALTGAMYSALAEAFTGANSNPEVRSVLILGQADCFTAGNDLVDFLAVPPNGPDSPVVRFMRSLANLEKPVIAGASGIAVGVGVTLLLHCDLVYCGEQTKLNMPFASLGICPEFASSYLLPRLMGHVRAAELLLLGEGFGAAKALEYGLVNAVLPNAEVEATARAKALQVAAMPPRASRITKMLLKKWSLPTINEAVDFEAGYFMAMLKDPEAREAMTAFMQKRKPDFSSFN
ncbi:MAG: enoyl-CoA hydratase [Stagnimonas sp.]|nr:enoyl-CoA hydratase [Stagnimonas sp.]